MTAVDKAAGGLLSLIRWIESRPDLEVNWVVCASYVVERRDELLDHLLDGDLEGWELQEISDEFSALAGVLDTIQRRMAL